MKLLMIDNFDSFTYNLVQYLGELGASVQVYRNNAFTLQDICAMNPEGIVISPGPGNPETAGICLSVIREFASTYPILGVCLGHQAIARAFGGKIIVGKELMHGKTSQIFHENENIFEGLTSPFQAARYHSLIVDHNELPDCLRITARTDSGLIMGLTHETWPVYGIQFHPESFLSEWGKELLSNFLKQIRSRN